MKRVALLLLGTALMVSCSNNESFMSPRNVVVDMPKTHKALPHQKLDMEVIGLWSARSADSLLLLRVEMLDNSLVVANSSTLEVYDTVLNTGRGPGEYINFATQGQYYKKDGDMILWTRDNGLKKIRSINLTQTLDKGQTVVVDEYRFNGNFYNIYNVGEKSLVGDFYDDKKQEFYFSRYDAGTKKWKHYFPFFKRFVSDISVRELQRYPEADNGMMAFAMIYFNQLLITPIDGSDPFTVSLGAPIKEEDVLEKDMLERSVFFKPLASTDDQIWALYENSRNPESDLLLVFGWDGKVQYSFDLGVELRTIFFDALDGSKLYGVDYNENILLFDVGDYV